MSLDAAIAPVQVKITVNAVSHALEVEPRRSLADVLRRELSLTGTRVGCEQGVCGSCTVLVDGEPVRSCLMLAAQADGSSIETVESLAAGGKLNELQQAFKACHGLQCGFCTPGFLMLCTDLVRRQPDADRQQIRECVSANLCRCTGYETIIDAVESVTQADRSQR